MNHNGHTDANAKIKALIEIQSIHYARLKRLQDAENNIISVLNKNDGYMIIPLIPQGAYDRIMFHVERVLREEEMKERLRFEKEVEGI